MKYKSLGNTDLLVSLICLGTMTWGEQNNENEAFEQMDYSMEKGSISLIQQSTIQLLVKKRHMVLLKK